MYSARRVEEYRGKRMYEGFPHVFALAEDTYRQLKMDRVDQCVIISGESGAGKTEASKKIMQYIAATSGSSKGIQRVKDKILATNPLLEAFGNAKTVRNNNSSRFGKYMQIFFDLRNDPAGASIVNYLLEKSRVVNPAENERNFHIFYQMCKGLGSNEKSQYYISRAEDFRYLSRGNCVKVDRMNDQTEFRDTLSGMQAIGMTQEEIGEVWSLVSAVMWIGQVDFVPVKGEKSAVKDKSMLSKISSLLRCDTKTLEACLTSRHFKAGGIGKAVLTFLDPQQAEYTRDALSKILYSRLFDWIVRKVNESLDLSHQTGSAAVDHKSAAKIGVLDIYGFEIFENNSFEQFCINFVNEKLQQVFIEKTLRSEQDEYKQEGIQWTPVKYFNNKIVCDLIEKRPNGIFKFLDDECVYPRGTDKTFYEKLCSNPFLKKHDHFGVPDSKRRPRKARDASLFVIRHYAGDVTYCVDGFLDKNKDLTWKDILVLGESSELSIMSSMFPAGKSNSRGTKRPPTIGTSFKKQVNSLMHALEQCQPHYIRCIKSNNQKKAMVFEDELVLHQVKYLGLLENVRVRRAGFAFRETFERFLGRYKMLTKETWPQWNGDPRAGCGAIMRDKRIAENEFQMGKTKIFVRNPQTVFMLEEQRERRVHELVTKIQAVYRSWKARKYLLELRKKSLGLFGNRKVRRRISIKRFYVGDYLRVSNDARVMVKVLGKNNETMVKFADNVDKINKRYKSQQRMLVLSEGAVYNLKPNYSMRRRIPIDKISAVSLSKLSDNFMVIHVRSEYDYVIVCERKTEFLTTLNDLYRKLKGEDLQLKFENRLEYYIEGKKKRVLEFAEGKGKETTWTVDKASKGTVLKIAVGNVPTVPWSSLDDQLFGAPKRPTIKKNARQRKPSAREIWAKAVYDFTAEESEELSFRAGDMMKILEQDPDWWVAELRGKRGFVPANYVKTVGMK